MTTSGAATARTYGLLLRDIEDGLRSGRIGAGDRLPAERALAERYGISRASVREGLRILDALGVVRSEASAGPKSGALIVSEPAAGLSSALRLHVASRRLPVADIVEARILLETWAARTAPRRAGRESLERARRALEAMDAPGITQEAFHRLDAEFHLALSSAAGNSVIETMMDSLSGSIRDYIREGLASAGPWPAVLDRLRRDHHAIFRAAEAGEGPEAAALLEAHIGWLHEQSRDRPAPSA